MHACSAHAHKALHNLYSIAMQKSATRHFLHSTVGQTPCCTLVATHPIKLYWRSDKVRGKHMAQVHVQVLCSKSTPLKKKSDHHGNNHAGEYFRCADCCPECAKRYGREIFQLSGWQILRQLYARATQSAVLSKSKQQEWTPLRVVLSKVPVISSALPAKLHQTYQR